MIFYSYIFSFEGDLDWFTIDMRYFVVELEKLKVSSYRLPLLDIMVVMIDSVHV